MDPQDKLVLTVGRLASPKGHTYLLDAIHKIRQQWTQVRFVLAGDGPLRKELEAQAQQLGIQDHVRFLGKRDDVPDLLGIADLFVLPSISEGLPVALLEAMSTGLPVIATQLEGISSIQTLGHPDVPVYLLVPPADSDALTDAIIRMLSDAVLRERYAEAGKELIMNEYTVEKNVPALCHTLPGAPALNERSSPTRHPPSPAYGLLLTVYGILVVFLPMGAAWECYRVIRNLALWQPVYTRELILGLLLLPVLWAMVAFIAGALMLVPTFTQSSILQIRLPIRTLAFQKILRLGLSVFQRFSFSAIQWRTRLGRTRWLLIVALLVLPVWLLLHSGWGMLFTGPYYRYLLLISVSLLVAALLQEDSSQLVAAPQWVAALLLVSCAITFGQAIGDATSYPFSLTWSEGNRMWDYSVLFGHRLYDYPVDQPIQAYIDWGRQVMWGLPFLFADINIVQMRIWSGLLFSVPYMIFGWIIFHLPSSNFKKVSGSDGLWFLTGLWTFLFLNQGPIYAPLVISAILIALAWRRSKWIGLPLVFLAGYFAQASRFTWMFAPAMWAGILYFADLLPGAPASRRVNASNWKLAIAGGIAGLAGGYLYPRLAMLSWLQSIRPNPAWLLHPLRHSPT